MRFKIGDICDINKSSLKKNHNLDFINYLDTGNITEGRVDEIKKIVLAEEKIPSRAKRIVKENDIIISTVRPNQKHYGIIKNPIENLIVSTGFVVLSPKKEVNADYLYNYLTLPNITEYLQGIAETSTTAYPSITPSVISDLEIELPSLVEQKAIADILSSLDEKIELNNQMNQTLEEMAQALFKRWFVDFEFPNEEGQPYKSSGGEMVESELGMIPKGWELSSVYDLGDYINGTSFKKNDYSEHGVPIIKIAELKQGITSGTRYFKGDKDKKYYLENGDILFSWSGNPDTSIDTFIWHRGDAILNQHIFKVVPNYKVNGSYIYSLLKYFKPMFAETARNKQTTGLGHVTVSDLKRIKTTLDKEICRKYYSICESIIEQIINNNLENNMLIKLRDTLLPKLMSGEIRVSDFES